uniref:C2H2-type domain-containing protein n=1 Tax=viral metagenome TaxID=1070528 RepID=A0A6C0ICY1_9ZZZZ
MLAIAKSPKNRKKYFCKKCDYFTYNKYDFDKHNNTIKHFGNDLAISAIAKSEKSQKNKFMCPICNKQYKDNSGLWRHKKKCNNGDQDLNKVDEEPQPADKDKLIDYLIHEHTELKNLILEIVKKDSITNNTNNTINSHNKSFNLQFFLNETCKDAMNIMEFVESIQIQLSDLEKVGELGYVEGISNIIIKNLNGLDVTQRPIHCTDKKREVLYVKDEDLWQKEDEQNKKVRTAIKKISDKNMRLIPQFQKINPDCNKSESKVSDKYNTIVVESMGGKGENYIEKENKIISNISKQVIVEKDS